jgi:hypothetical protein
MDNKKKEHLGLNEEDTFFDAESVVSATECTGLIQTPPSSVDEAEAYGKIYDIPHTEDKVNNGLQSVSKSKNNTDSNNNQK